MRQSTIYVIVTSCLTYVVVLFIVKQPKWSKDALKNFASSGPLIFDRDSFIKEKMLPDISSIISSQPYYKLRSIFRFCDDMPKCGTMT